MIRLSLSLSACLICINPIIAHSSLEIKIRALIYLRHPEMKTWAHSARKE